MCCSSRNKELKGFTVNWEKYNNLKNHWKTVNNKTLHCEIHNTYFNPQGEDGEPCWQCWNSCQKEVKNDKRYNNYVSRLL